MPAAPALLPLRHLRTVAVVAEAGGIRAAAERLLRAPSAVSRGLALLEQALGQPLFERHGRGLLPTPAGERLCARHARIAAELAAVLAEAGQGAAGPPPASAAAAAEALFDERRLQAAALLAEVGHMPTVARRLGVTQPAISAAIARLEDALRERLFLRGPRGLLPSAAGGRWLPRFDRALAELRYLGEDIAALQGRLTGLVAVGALPLSRTRLLPRAVAALRRRHPGLQVRAVESPYEQLLADLLRGRIDFIVGSLRPATDAALQQEVLFSEELGILAGTGHPLARRRRLALADLRGQPWVLSRPGSPLRSRLDAFFLRHGQEAPQPAVETGDLALVRGMLLEGGMLTMLSRHQLHYELQAGLVCQLPVDLEGMHRRIGFTTRRDAQLPAGALALMEAVRGAAAGL